MAIRGEITEEKDIHISTGKIFLVKSLEVSLEPVDFAGETLKIVVGGIHVEIPGKNL